MKKHNVFSKIINNSNSSNVLKDTLDEPFTKLIRHIAIFFMVCLISLFSSCSSIPIKSYVHPADLIDEHNAFYLAIPKVADDELVSRMISMYIPQLSSKDIKKITDRTDNIYCGLNMSRNGKTIQAAIEGNIPTSFVPRILTKKNGWTTRKYFNSKNQINHTIYTFNDIDVSFPCNRIVLVGRNIEYMLDTYDALSTLPESISADHVETVAPVIGLNEETKYSSIKNFLKEAQEEIRFYANEPKTFLSLLTGTDLDLKLTDVSGSFKIDCAYGEQYILNIYMTFKQNKYLKAGKALLGLVFGLTGADTTIVGSNQLQVTGIEIGKQQLYKILSI